MHSKTCNLPHGFSTLITFIAFTDTLHQMTSQMPLLGLGLISTAMKFPVFSKNRTRIISCKYDYFLFTG